jgi:hypothetical protein
MDSYADSFAGKEKEALAVAAGRGGDRPNNLVSG